MELIKPTNKRVVELTKHYAPVEAMVRKTWARYSCFRLFEDVPVEGDLFQKMMQYVHVIDKQ